MGKTAQKPVPQAPAVPNTLGSLIITVKDPAGNPIVSEATVFVRRLEETRHRLTDDQGIVKFPDLAAGVVDVTIDPAPGFGPVPAGNAPFKAGASKISVNIEEGPETTFRDVVFTKALGFLIVKVLDTKRQPLAKVPVEISPASAEGISRFSTNGSGIADFGPVTPGLTYHIKAGTTDLTVKPFFGPTNGPPEPAVIGLRETDRSVALAEVATVVVQLELKKLDIVKVDDHFASSKEPLEIRFAIAGLAGRKVVLTIEGENYPGNTLVRRDLGTLENADGDNNLISWDGQIKLGPSQDQFANPLMGPFKVKFFHDALLSDKTTHTGVLTAEKKFKILYHSLELKQGPFTPDEKEPDKAAKEKEWVQFKLNQLGYYGGPVGKDVENYLEKAILLYKANHKKMYQMFPANYRPDIDQPFKDALTAGENSRPALVGDAFGSPGGTAKVMVQEIYYQYLGATLTGAGAGSEFRNGSRSVCDDNKLNRPLIPLEATIFLKAKDNSKKLAPEAVGPVRINFRMKDPNENLATQLSPTASEPSQTKKYLEAALVINNGRSGDNGDNCPSTLNGIRRTAQGTSFDAPFLLGDAYQPYATASDGGQKVVFSTASTDKKFPLRLGKAGIFFRPSYIAGDDYQLRAEIDFTGQPTQAALEADHAATTVAKRIHLDTGTFVVTRFCKVAAIVTWPSRTKNAAQLDLVKAEFARAHVELDTSSVATKNISDVLTTADYLAQLQASGLTAQPGMTVKPNAYFGGPTPPQGNMNAGQYRTLLQGFAAEHGFFDRSSPLVGAEISKKVRAEFPVGIILITINQHEPVDVQTDPAHGNHSVLQSNRQFVAGYNSVGLPDGVIFLDLQDPEKVYYVTAHEMGHLFFLRHWENAKDTHPTFHDLNDHNCLMSYGVDPALGRVALPFQTQGRFTPHFCGKCNLGLRGWEQSNRLLAKQS
ncbi:MAG TPA: carboxypeptidase-like regulatory domain-containing protein [Candidatus Sulfopaludibacter sp.]|jgi:hypothetical protein|nr:carboxypeptidase-like regulatory domain-containing protein [Candidatus Sulfopaludibacter sp.]